MGINLTNWLSFSPFYGSFSLHHLSFFWISSCSYLYSLSLSFHYILFLRFHISYFLSFSISSIFTFFFFGEIRNLTTFCLLPLVNNGFSLSSFFLSLLSFLWIGAQFPQEKFLSYGRILTLHYYFLLMCILFFGNYFLNLRTSGIHLFYNLQLFYW